MAERKADLVAGDLLRRIVRGDYTSGDLLPREADLAARYGVNRGVVREAVKLLEVHRLVRPKRRRGTEVLDPLASMSPEVFRAMLRPDGGRIDPDALADLLELRAHLDVELCGLAAERRLPEGLAAIEGALGALRAACAAGDAAEFSAGLTRLSLALAATTGNRLYAMLVQWHARVVVDLGALMNPVRRPSAPHLQGVELLCDLVRQGDADGARALVRGFHDWATPRLLAELAARDPEPDPDPAPLPARRAP